MAFVARTDQHGNEIMRVMLSTEPGNRTIASCHNLHINCCPLLLPRSAELGEGHFDHLRRFHSFVEPLAPNASNKKVLVSTEADYTDEAEAELEAEEEIEEEVEEEAEAEAELDDEVEVEEEELGVTPRELEVKADPVKKSETQDETAVWSNSEINAHSTLLTSRPLIDRRDKITTFYAWLTAKNEEQQQRAKSERELAQLEEERAEERTRLAQEKYENWLATKATQMRRAKSDLSSGDATQQQHQQQGQRHLTPRASLPPAETQRRLVAWEREKISRLRALRARQEQDEARHRQVEGARRELSADAWEQWATEARNRPRPVPIGRGLDSLRGSMAPHFINPNEWQPPVVEKPQREEDEKREEQEKQQQQQQQQQPTAASRPGPDYERLERLAQPRRAFLRTTNTRSGSDIHNVAAGAGAGAGAATGTGTAAGAKEEEEPDPAHRLPQPQRQPSVWSNQNAFRARQLRSLINDRAMEARMRQLKLRDDQLEQLRQQQHMQDSKQLPRKYHEKREQLKEHLKVWVQQGELLPERLHRRQGEKLQTQLAREIGREQKSDTDTDGELEALWKRKQAKVDQRQQQQKEIPPQERLLEQQQQHQQQRVQERQQEQRQQELYQQHLLQPKPAARTSRRPPQPQQRTRSSEAPCIFKRQQKSRPWR